MQSPQTSNRDRQKPPTPIALSVQRPSFDRCAKPPVSSLLQVESFSRRLKKIRYSVYIFGGLLILFSVVCLDLFFHKIDIIALFFAGALVLSIQIAMIWTDYFHEKKRVAQAYWDYLDTYSYQVIMALRKTAQLSDWSRCEIDKYLSVLHP